MYGRNWNTGNYRFGFNGKEKDDEVNREGVLYNFEARLLRTDLGIFLSNDADFKSHPSGSNYRSFRNNPLIFVDPSGNTEYLFIDVVNKKTGKTTSIQVKLSNDYSEHVVQKSTMGHDTYDSYYYRDIEHHETITIDENGKITREIGATTESKDIKYTRTALTRWLPFMSWLDTKHEGSDNGTQISIMGTRKTGNGKDDPADKGDPKKRTVLIDFGELKEIIDPVMDALEKTEHIQDCDRKKLLKDVKDDFKKLIKNPPETFGDNTDKKNINSKKDTVRCTLKGGCGKLHTEDKINVLPAKGKKIEDYKYEKK